MDLNQPGLQTTLGAALDAASAWPGLDGIRFNLPRSVGDVAGFGAVDGSPGADRTRTESVERAWPLEVSRYFRWRLE